jgi:hypothetical protein
MSFADGIQDHSACQPPSVRNRVTYSRSTLLRVSWPLFLHRSIVSWTECRLGKMPGSRITRIERSAVTQLIGGKFTGAQEQKPSALAFLIQQQLITLRTSLHVLHHDLT